MKQHSPLPWASAGTIIWSPALFSDQPRAVVAQVSEPRATGRIQFTKPSIGSQDWHEISANTDYIIKSANNFPRAVELLRPLAALWDKSLELRDDSWPAWGLNGNVITVGLIRQARDFLKEIE